MDLILLIGMWLVEGPDGRRMVHNVNPPIECIWPGSKVKYHKDLEAGNHFDFEIVNDEIQKKVKPVEKIPKSVLVNAEIEAALKEKAVDPATTDVEFAKLLRYKYMPEAQRMTEWEKTK